MRFLRIFSGFDHLASLLLHQNDPNYYITLSHNGTRLRVLKAPDLYSTEAVFHNFEEQVVRLSKYQMRQAQTEAQDEQLTRMLVQAEAQVKRLRKHLQRKTSQE
ncbi:DUF2968 domain-containing protein [Trinickia violacea]|uniref:DUF2968 domain-containing protein n=1 Tax=Trinickia violacea TaxID=2571746 RepID=A0A4P8J0Z4_9BURK|nr:DUF2968 domain-containing protein [Trinickia violacea]QCP54446.1 DUF2968 domain-containing protein [Trinickia violacea]